jgi:hypothetical protein
MFATSKCRRQRATNTATAYVSSWDMNPSMDCVADVKRADNCSRMGAYAVHSNMTENQLLIADYNRYHPPTYLHGSRHGIRILVPFRLFQLWLIVVT